jgi:hypothetical protein
MANEQSIWEIKNEKNKAGVRWVLVLAIAGYLSYLLRSDGVREISLAAKFDAYYIIALTGFAITFNALITVLLHRAGKRAHLSPWLKYVTMTCDFLLVALVLIPTGGSASLFYPINYVIIVSNALRYGMGIALTGTFVMNIFYLGVLWNQYYPSFRLPGFHQEMLKVSAFWLVGIYTGYLSRRYTRLRGEVEHYQKLLSEALKK